MAQQRQIGAVLPRIRWCSLLARDSKPRILAWPFWSTRIRKIVPCFSHKAAGGRLGQSTSTMAELKPRQLCHVTTDVARYLARLSLCEGQPFSWKAGRRRVRLRLIPASARRIREGNWFKKTQTKGQQVRPFSALGKDGSTAVRVADLC